jgi:hypothetical protein
VPPIQIQLPASIPADLRLELDDTLRRLGPVYEPPAKLDLTTLNLILAGISAAADLLAIAALLIEWRDHARRRGVNLERAVIECGKTRIRLENVDSQTLARLLGEIKDCQ